MDFSSSQRPLESSPLKRGSLKAIAWAARHSNPMVLLSLSHTLPFWAESLTPYVEEEKTTGICLVSIDQEKKFVLGLIQIPRCVNDFLTLKV